ncbi:MAG TPA: RNA 2',3'-cyclic phosphodiesterase [Paracoccaceae bacterium]|nr:RNA 2',3'-cyclic phosphodiesterase [Paracoccaceae bacterium]
MPRVFLALTLPPEVRSALAVVQFLLPLPRRVEPETFHLTLAFLGEVPGALLHDVHDALEAVRSPAFALTLRGAGLFGGARPRAAWVGVAPCAALDRLQAKVAFAAHRAGAPPEARKFVPHVTLGRFAPPAPDEVMRLERAVAGQAGFVAGPFAVTEFALMESHVSARGSRYDALARYPLEG